MSYSFKVRAATKLAVLAAVAAAFDNVIASQPIHAKDRAAALSNAETVVGLLPGDASDTQDVIVSCNGYVSWNGATADNNTELTGASVSCSARYAAKLQPLEPIPAPAPAERETETITAGDVGSLSDVLGDANESDGVHAASAPHDSDEG